MLGNTARPLEGGRKANMGSRDLQAIAGKYRRPRLVL